MSNDKWETVAGEWCDHADHRTEFCLRRRGKRWQVTVKRSCKDHHQVTEVLKETEGRGNSPRDACEAVEKDVFAWCISISGGNLLCAEYATALRAIFYAAEDIKDAEPVAT